MRYLVLSDIHANLEAFQAVLAAAGDDFDATLFLGDLVGYGPNPNECTELLLEQPDLTGVIGNHDIAALGGIDLDTFNSQAKAAAQWTQDQMCESTRSYLQSLGQVEELNDVTLVHGSPRDPVWEYLESRSQGPESFARFTTNICFNGHTHVPRVFTQDPETKVVEVAVPAGEEVVETHDAQRRIINPGGVGQPRDGDPRAAFGFFEPESGVFTFQRVAYDVQKTQSKMGLAGLPEALAARLAYGI